MPRHSIVFTRSLNAGKRWARQQMRSTERCGLLASSKAMRLKSHAIDVRIDANPIHYFLGDPEDERSSFYLEDCATEFQMQVQGLELDGTCVTWNAPERNRNEWSFHDLRASKWQSIHSEENRRSLKNAYRVLLTRASQGMVIFLPPGSEEDPTRPPSAYNGTYAYFRGIGLVEVSWCR